MRDNLRLWVVGTVLLTGTLLAGGWFLGVQPFLASATASSARIEAAQQRTVTLSAQLAALKEKAQDRERLELLAEEAGRAVPNGLGAKAFIKRLNAIASKGGLEVRSIVPGEAQPYTVPTGVGPVSSDGVAAEGTESAAAESAEPAIGLQAATDPSITGDNFVVIPISVQVSGYESDVLEFVNDVQNDSRLFLVNEYSSTRSTGTSEVDATLQGFIYALKTE